MNASILSIMVLAAMVSISSAVVTIDWVTVGNPGNAADSTGYGAVGYTYKIARNETTTGQYAEFLNAVAIADPYKLYSTNMAAAPHINCISRSGTDGNYSYSVVPGTANKPIAFVSWFDAARFCNWLHNGQGNGSTETGAYTLNGVMNGTVQKNADAKFWIPTGDEWYKAAYYDPTKIGTVRYWLYPTRSNNLAGNAIGCAWCANYDSLGSLGYTGMVLTDVGAYGPISASFYGTNDQGGNVSEWVDSVILSGYLGLRGGSWLSRNAYDLCSSSIIGYDSSRQADYIGFRIAAPPDHAVDFRVTSCYVFAGGRQVQLAWNSQPSGTYGIESSPDFAASSWTLVASGIVSQGHSTTHTLEIAPGPRRFFRVTKQP